MKKEAITHGVLEDLANRNENWDKLDGVPEKVNELDESRLTLKNEIVNGDFSDGTTGWTKDDLSTTISATNNVLSISSSRTIQSYVRTPLSVPNQATMYIRMEFEIDKSVTKVYSRGFHGGYEIASNAPVVNTPQILSGVVINDGSDFTIRFIQSVAQLTTLKVKKVLTVDLTTTFGAGNEPTKEEMDELMKVVPNGWWDGELDLTQQQYVNWLLSFIREKANKQQEAWITPTLLNGWTANIVTPQYMKDSLGFVHFRGRIASGARGTVAFALPEGYRPSVLTGVTGMTEAGTNGRINISIAGNVEVSTYSSYLYLDGITFKVERLEI